MSNGSAPQRQRRKRRPDILLSPLRYPGGKRRLAPYIAEALRLNNLRPQLYVEPFAGGASVAIQLLQDDLVDRIVLGEKDPMVAGFWKVVFTDHERLIAEIRKLRPTLENWEYYRRTRPRSALGWAVKCLFLNRTSFSGILSETAGPIGGRQQVSDYAIDCRFPIERLARRISQIAAFADRVAFIHHGDWQELIIKVNQLDYTRDQLFYYLDPPFYEKAERLYRYYFREPDHQQLHHSLSYLNGNYILSYDAAESIVARYSMNGNGLKHVDLLYSATSKGELVKARELIVSNLPLLPEHMKLWHSELADVSSLTEIEHVFIAEPAAPPSNSESQDKMEPSTRHGLEPVINSSARLSSLSN